MNFLTNLYFSQGKNENFTTGLIIGSAIKPNILPKYNSEIRKAISFDENLKNFSDTHEAFLKGLDKIDSKFTRFKPFILRIYFDHFLARFWKDHTDASLEEFGDRIYRVIIENHPIFPYKIRKFSSEMIAKKWITNLSSIDGTHNYLRLMLKKERFSFNLEQCMVSLIENYQTYRNDFETYFSDLKAVSEELETAAPEQPALVSA